MLALMRIIDGKNVFVSGLNPNQTTDNFDEALKFFSENHIFVWRKSNPDIVDTIAVDVVCKNGKLTINNVEDNIIGW